MFFIKTIHWFIFRLFETHPNIQVTFPSFKGVSLDELMNSRSLYLHAKRVMAAVESTISALDDAELLVESLTNLGQRHRPWSIREEHFKVIWERFRTYQLKRRETVGPTFISLVIYIRLFANREIRSWMQITTYCQNTTLGSTRWTARKLKYFQRLSRNFPALLPEGMKKCRGER